MNPQLFSGVLALTISIQPAFCASTFDWPQWQGPNRTAHSKETGLLKEWPKDGPPLAWKINGLGGGDSTPSVAAGRIYGMSHRGADEIVWALSENHPALLRMLELETLRDLNKNGNARIYIGFDKHAAVNGAEKGD